MLGQCYTNAKINAAITLLWMKAKSVNQINVKISKFAKNVNFLNQ